MPEPTYVTDIPRVALSTVCEPDSANKTYTIEELNAEYLRTDGKKGIASVALNYSEDPNTHRISSENLRAAKDVLTTANILKPRASTTVTVRNPDGLASETEQRTIVEQQVADDAELYNNMRDEYCYYERRYNYALRTFLDQATSRTAVNQTQIKSLLDTTIGLNRRLNFVIEFMNYMAISRATDTNANVSAINTLNAQITETHARVKTVYSKISSLSAVTETQKEMIRYTKEKNNNVTNQISVWAALNVLAIASIFYIYRSG